MTLGPDLLLDPSTWDLALENGTPSVGADVPQAIGIRLKFVLGEWFLDQELGIPYYESIFVKAPGIDRIKAIFREAILSTPGVGELTALDVDYNPSTRRFGLTFKCTTDEGEIDQTLEIAP
jgi:hypothetical protein